MKEKKLIICFLFLIVFLGGFLRFWQLSKYPVSLSIDEVAIAYNAYSILKTGKDEWGQFLPLAFRSVGDYKPPVLVYLMVPAIGVFGLTEFGTRFTVALFGTLTIFFVYLLIKQISKNEKVSLLTALSLAISPWHIQYSRMTHEAVAALFFVITGTWIFLRSLQSKRKWYWLAGIFFALTLYTYHSERLFTPIFVLGLALIFLKDIGSKSNRKSILSAIILGVLISLPFLKIMLGPEGKTRAASTFINRDVEINSQLHQKSENLSLIQKIFDNNFLTLFNFWAKRYLGYFDLGFLFFNGMKLSLPQAPGVGLFHLFELPLFLIGIWQLLIKRKILSSKMYFLIIFWYLLGPLAASFANNEQHAARSLTTVPVPQFFVGVGFLMVWEKVKNLSLRKKILTSGMIFFVLIISLVYYLDLYFIHYSYNYSEYWQYGMKEIAQYVWVHQKEYEKIIIDPVFGTNGPYTVGTPYLYVYFYGKYDPKSLQNDSLHGKGENKDSTDFLNFSFRHIYWPEDRYQKNTLFVGSPWSLPKEDLNKAKILKEISFLNGREGFLIVESQETK